MKRPIVKQHKNILLDIIILHNLYESKGMYNIRVIIKIFTWKILMQLSLSTSI